MEINLCGLHNIRGTGAIIDKCMLEFDAIKSEKSAVQKESANTIPSTVFPFSRTKTARQFSPSDLRVPWLSLGCTQWFFFFHFRPQITSVGPAGVAPPDPPVRSQTPVACSVSHAGSARASCGRCGLGTAAGRETADCTPHCHYHMLHFTTHGTLARDL